MCNCKLLPGPGMTKAQADFISCLLAAAVAAAPVFLQALMNCLSGGNEGTGNDAYTPGDRTRCK